MARIPKREGQQVEFKRSFAEEDAAIRSLCAMANSRGGRVFFGVDDDGSPVGVQLGGKTLEGFAHKIRSNTQPNLAPDVRPLQVHGNRVVVANTRAAPPGTVYYAFGVPYIRVGKTNQLMPPPDIQRQIMATFAPQVRGNQPAGAIEDESWDERERRRIATYERNRGLFLVHRWRPSSEPGQTADIEIELRQHREGPLTEGRVKSVEYHLGPMFANRTLVQTNSEQNFRLEVSAYGPFLCLATVRFDDGSASVDLERYVDLS